MVVRMCVCLLVCSAVKISTVVSPRDKARTDIANPGGWLSLIIFPIPYRAIGCLTLRVSREANSIHEGEQESHKEAQLQVLIQLQLVQTYNYNISTLLKVVICIIVDYV